MNYERQKRTPAEQAEADSVDRRQFWIIAVIFTVAIVALTGIYAVVSDTVQPPSPETGAAQQVDEPALPIPDGGTKPTSPGDRGGSQQMLLMGGLFVVFAAGTAWVVHSSRRARKRLAEQHAADRSPADPDVVGVTVDAASIGGETHLAGETLSASTESPEPR